MSCWAPVAGLIGLTLGSVLSWPCCGICFELPWRITSTGVLGIGLLLTMMLTLNRGFSSTYRILANGRWPCFDTSKGWTQTGCLLARATRGLRRMGEGTARCPSCSQNAHGEKGWNDTRAGPLLPERARSDGARSTAAVGPTRVPFLWEENELAWEGSLMRAVKGQPRPLP